MKTGILGLEEFPEDTTFGNWEGTAEGVVNDRGGIKAEEMVNSGGAIGG